MVHVEAKQGLQVWERSWGRRMTGKTGKGLLGEGGSSTLAATEVCMLG